MSLSTDASGLNYEYSATIDPPAHTLTTPQYLALTPEASNLSDTVPPTVDNNDPTWLQLRSVQMGIDHIRNTSRGEQWRLNQLHTLLNSTLVTIDQIEAQQAQTEQDAALVTQTINEHQQDVRDRFDRLQYYHENFDRMLENSVQDRLRELGISPQPQPQPEVDLILDESISWDDIDNITPPNPPAPQTPDLVSPILHLEDSEEFYSCI